MVYHKKPFSDSYFFPCLCCINLLKIQLGRKTENLHKMFSNKDKSVLLLTQIKEQKGYSVTLLNNSMK